MSNWGNQASTPQSNSNSNGQAINKEEAIANQILNSVSVDEGKQIQTQGIKGWIVKKAIRTVASAIRYGGSLVSRILQYSDSGAKKIFYKYSNRIANGLDEISNIPDVTALIVKQRIYNLMVNELGIQGRYALQIADGIYWVINNLIF